MNDEIRQRLRWIKLYQRTGDAGLVCRRCGISRPTLRKWVRRYQELGLEGLKSQSRRPKHSPGRKALAQQEQWILDLRRNRNLGVRRIQNELKHLHECSLSLSTIHRVLTEHRVEPLIRIKRVHKPKRYQKATPGERVQMDTCKIAPGVYQYTAVDECRLSNQHVYCIDTANNVGPLVDIPFPGTYSSTVRSVGDFVLI